MSLCLFQNKLLMETVTSIIEVFGKCCVCHIHLFLRNSKSITVQPQLLYMWFGIYQTFNTKNSLSHQWNKISSLLYIYKRVISVHSSITDFLLAQIFFIQRTLFYVSNGIKSLSMPVWTPSVEGVSQCLFFVSGSGGIRTQVLVITMWTPYHYPILTP